MMMSSRLQLNLKDTLIMSLPHSSVAQQFRGLNLESVNPSNWMLIHALRRLHLSPRAIFQPKKLATFCLKPSRTMMLS